MVEVPRMVEDMQENSFVHLGPAFLCKLRFCREN